jgi:hypothetical protein
MIIIAENGRFIGRGLTSRLNLPQSLVFPSIAISPPDEGGAFVEAISMVSAWIHPHPPFARRHEFGLPVPLKVYGPFDGLGLSQSRKRAGGRMMELYAAKPRRDR